MVMEPDGISPDAVQTGGSGPGVDPYIQYGYLDPTVVPTAGQPGGIFIQIGMGLNSVPGAVGLFQKILTTETDTNWVRFGTGAGIAGITVADEGVDLVGLKTRLNFVGAGVTATNGVPGTATVTIPSGGFDMEVEDEGVLVTSNPTFMNFIGLGVTAVADGLGVDILIPGGGGGGPLVVENQGVPIGGGNVCFPLGAAADYGVLAGSTVTNVGGTVVSAKVGVFPGAAIVGFPPGVTTVPPLHMADADAQAGQLANVAAYAALAALVPASPLPYPAGNDLSGQNLAGKTLAPGTYFFAAAADLAALGTLILDGGGDPNSQFVFQIGSALTANVGSIMSLINGASAKHVFWQVGSSATVGVGATFAGSILALASITVNTGASVDGRLLAQTGAVTMDTNAVSGSPCVASPAVPITTLNFTGCGVDATSGAPGTAIVNVMCPKRDKFTIAAPDIVNGYLDLSHLAFDDSVIVTLESAASPLLAGPGTLAQPNDYTFSVVAGVTRLTFNPAVVALWIVGQQAAVNYMY